MSDSGPGDDVRFRVIRAVAALDGYEHPNAYPGSWWDVRMAPVVAMVRDLIKEARSAAAPDMAQERARALAITFRDEWRKAVADRTSRFSDLEERVSLARNALFAHLDAAPAAPDGIAATGLAARTEAALLLELLNELHYRRGRFAKVTVDDVMGALEFVRDPRTAARLAATPAESGAGEL